MKKSLIYFCFNRKVGNKYSLHLWYVYTYTGILDISKVCLSQSMTITFDFTIFWYTDEFMVDAVTEGCPGPLAVKQT